ncbi:MAG: site-2 protease family protein [Anaerolineales bacterium]
MKWNWKIGRFAGIDVYVHVTFLLIIGWVAYSHWLANREWSQVLAGELFILALFACVVLHEYGHALTARKYGIHTRDITLYPIGGVARLERMPEKPIEELWVALMGPVVNIVIAGVLFAYLFLRRGMIPFSELSLTSGDFIVRLMMVNISLVLFNMLPAFPMDGGRVLRALIALRMEYVRATRLAANVGQGMAFLFGFLGLFSNPFLILIAFFVWMGASQEADMVSMKNSLSGAPVVHAMQTRFDILSPRDTLNHVASLVLASSQQDFPVAEDGRVVGVVTRDDFIKALTQDGQTTPVVRVMRSNLPIVNATERIEAAVERLQQSGTKTLPVLHLGRLVGLITSENISEFLMIQSAIKAARPQPS